MCYDAACVKGSALRVTAADRAMAAVVADRNSRQKHVWRRIILATAEGCGTVEINRAGVSKPCV